MWQNLELARAFEEIADLLEVKGENPYKIRAYRRGAQAVALLPVPVADLVKARALESVDGIGKALAAKAEEWLSRGTIRYREELAREIPPGLIAVTRIPGIGPKLAKRLYDEIGVASLDDLAQAVAEGKLRNVKGLGPKAEAKIERGLAQAAWGGGIPLGEAMELGEALLVAVLAPGRAERAVLAGPLRRRCECVDRIVIVASAGDPGPVLDSFSNAPHVREVLVREEERASATLFNGAAAEILIVGDREFPAALHRATGSEAHLASLSEHAARRGFSIQERGLQHAASGRVILPGSEDELYGLLGLPHIPPELREGRGEVERALRGELPKLIDAGDIRGDLHVHSHWSDGRSTLVEMVRAAKERGLEYIAICDHSKALRIANGLSGADLVRQADEIAQAEAEVGTIRVLRGVEVDILADGSLDLDDATLERLDIVVASIHSGMQQDGEAITRRLVRAIENPHVDIIGHPTGRILARREPYEVDIDRVIAAALEHGKVLEINASPSRLDLKDTLAARAHAAGVRLAVNTDAHDVHELDNMRFGVWVARRAGLTKGAVVNTLNYDELCAWLRR